MNSKTVVCGCGSTKWERCGLQDTFGRGNDGKMILKRRKVPLVTCRKCHTTITCGKEFYNSLPPKQVVGDDACFVNK